MFTVIAGLTLGLWTIAYRVGAGVALRAIALIAGAFAGLLVFVFAVDVGGLAAELLLVAAIIAGATGLAAFTRSAAATLLWKRLRAFFNHS